MNQQSPNICHCLISHPQHEAFLIVKQGKNWVLPNVPLSGDWAEKTYTEISNQIETSYGLKATVLRRLLRGKNFLVCELEVHSQSRHSQVDSRWYDHKHHLKTGGLAAAANEVLDRWFTDAKSAESPNLRPPWECQGWFEDASNWITTELSSANILVKGEVRQVRAGAFGCVLVVPSNVGNIFFKASLGEHPSEAIVTEALAKRWPDHIVPLIKTDALRNWLLMRDYSALGYARLPSSRYAEAARTFAALLVEGSQSISQWQQLGCPDYGLEQLEAFSQNLSKQAHLLQSGNGALSQNEIKQLLRKVKELGALCSSLAKFPIPETLVNLDFRVQNIACGKTGVIYLDWRESVITHPFFSVLNMFDDIVPIELSPEDMEEQQQQDLENRMTIQRAFLEPFSTFDSADRIDDAFSIASSLQTIMRLKRWFGYLELLESNSFWAKEFEVQLKLWSKYLIAEK